MIAIVFNSLINLVKLIHTHTDDDVSPGNYAMLDHIEALKWIKENIEGTVCNDNNGNNVLFINPNHANVSYMCRCGGRGSLTTWHEDPY